MKSNRIKLHEIKYELRWVFFISGGIFLFILFFQPFPLIGIELDNRLLYVFGFGIIEYAFSCCIFVLLPGFFPKLFKTRDRERHLAVVLYLLLFVFSATAFTFYIHYVGQTSLTLYILFKIALVSLLPIIILGIAYRNEFLRRSNEQLKKQNKQFLIKLSNYETQNGEKEIEIFSGNKAESVTLKAKSLICIKSADNYVELTYFDKMVAKTKILRNTLKDIETQLSIHKYLIRCHRSCIVNTLTVDRLAKVDSNIVLMIKNTDLQIPVSRQYLSIVKRNISN